jgi:hypothetical protein
MPAASVYSRTFLAAEQLLLEQSEQGTLFSLPPSSPTPFLKLSWAEHQSCPEL